MNYKLLGVVLTLGLVFSACDKKQEEIVEKSNVKVVKILNLQNSSKHIQSFEYPAEIFAFQDATMAFEVSGKIVKFFYKEGQKVKKGSVIAKLDDAIYKANYDSAMANYNQAKLDYERYQKLFSSKSIAKIRLEQQRQTLDVNRALLQVAKKNLDETKLIAEFDGVLAKKLVDDFARVTTKQAIVRFQDNSSYKIKFFVPESDILRVQGELTPKYISSIVDFSVTLGKQNRSFDAKIIDISTTAEEVTRTFETTLQMNLQKNVTILPGMTAYVKATLKQIEQKSVFIPYKAVFTDDTKASFVWIVTKENRVKKQKVILGRVSGDSVHVVSGLDNSTKIVTSGIRFLESNDEVQEYKKIGN